MGGCALPNCTGNNRKGDRLFVFPVNPERRKIWMENCRIEHWGWTPTPKSRLCEHHFSPDQYEQNRADGLKKLKPNAIPTLFQYNSISDALLFRSKSFKKGKNRRKMMYKTIKMEPNTSFNENLNDNDNFGKDELQDHSYGREDRTEEPFDDYDESASENSAPPMELEINKCEVIVDCEQCHKLYLENQELRKQLLYTEQKLDKMENKFLDLLTKRQLNTI
uniref:THAP-type domain-containing protein n=1 Tax=Ciona savignyi TaxID=51511 RepID=H2YZK7_CIOSA